MERSRIPPALQAESGHWPEAYNFPQACCLIGSTRPSVGALSSSASWRQSDQSPHSFRVLMVTGLLSQNVPLKDVQYLAEHVHPARHADLRSETPARLPQPIGADLRLKMLLDYELLARRSAHSLTSKPLILPATECVEG